MVHAQALCGTEVSHYETNMRPKRDQIPNILGVNELKAIQATINFLPEVAHRCPCWT